MIVVYIVGGILLWAGVAFGLACLFRPGDGDRADAEWTAFVTAVWPISMPLIIAFAIPCLIFAGIAEVCSRYVDFLAGEKKPEVK